MIKPSTFLRAAIFRCESAAPNLEAQAAFQRLLEDARAFQFDDSPEVVISRLDFRRVPLDTVRALATELTAVAERSRQFILSPADTTPPADYPAQLRQAVQDASSAFALLAPLYAFIAVANGAEPWLAMERRRPPAAPVR